MQRWIVTANLRGHVPCLLVVGGIFVRRLTVMSTDLADSCSTIYARGQQLWIIEHAQYVRLETARLRAREADDFTRK
jgi:hypothetical protein